MPRSKIDEGKKREIVELSRKKNANLDAIAAQHKIKKKDIYNWRSLYTNGKNGKSKTTRTRRRYTSTDRARVVELEQQLGEAYVQIHKLQEYIINKLIE